MKDFDGSQLFRWIRKPTRSLWQRIWDKFERALVWLEDRIFNKTRRP